MKNIIFLMSIMFFTVSCKLVKTEKQHNLIPIKYDYKNLKLNLNSSISKESEFWRWNHMDSSNSVPDFNGIEYFENRSQPFLFNGVETLPSLFIKTDKCRIIEFSVTVLCHLGSKSIPYLLENLPDFDLFKDEQVKKEIITKGFYKKTHPYFEEEITIKYLNEEDTFQHITYKIKLTQNK